MKPSMPPGTLVVVRPTPVDEIGIGSVITYQVESGEPTVVTHRVVAQGIGATGEPVFRTQGDANDVPDATWCSRCRSRASCGTRCCTSAGSVTW